MELQTIKFIKENNNWKDLLARPPYSLLIKEDSHFYLLKYNQLESDFSNEIVKECRGLIVDKNTLEPIALSFKKFWEVENELANDIDWSSAKVQEKLDGSKLLCFYNKYDSEWQIATSGNLNIDGVNVNDFGMTFGQLFNKAIYNNGFKIRKEFFDLLDKNYCYTFELIAPENRVVVKYKSADLYLIGIRNVNTFEEVSTSQDKNITKYIKVPKEYSLSNLEDCLKATEQMTYNEEGYVVVDKNWHRIKVKSPAWKEVSKIRGDGILTKKKIITIIENGLIKETLEFYPEWEEYINKVKRELIHFKHMVFIAIDDVLDYMEENNLYIDNNTQMGEIAKYIKEVHPLYQSFIFKYIKMDKVSEFINNEWSNLTINKKLEYLKVVEND